MLAIELTGEQLLWRHRVRHGQTSAHAVLLPESLLSSSVFLLMLPRWLSLLRPLPLFNFILIHGPLFSASARIHIPLYQQIARCLTSMT